MGGAHRRYGCDQGRRARGFDTHQQGTYRDLNSLLSPGTRRQKSVPSHTMNQKELKELIEFLIEKDIAEFELERGDVKVRIRRGSEPVVSAATPDTRFFAVQ